MVRMGDVERAGISYSYHSDMPMAPSQPLFLMDCAVNRTTVSGRVAGPDQRSSREGALRAVTLEAAYSLRLENEVGEHCSGQTGQFHGSLREPDYRFRLPRSRTSRSGARCMKGAGCRSNTRTSATVPWDHSE